MIDTELENTFVLNIFKFISSINQFWYFIFDVDYFFISIYKKDDIIHRKRKLRVKKG